LLARKTVHKPLHCRRPPCSCLTQVSSNWALKMSALIFAAPGKSSSSLAGLGMLGWPAIGLLGWGGQQRLNSPFSGQHQPGTLPQHHSKP
jgi:hypothetical protein